jgi:hypothetical protein
VFWHLSEMSVTNNEMSVTKNSYSSILFLTSQLTFVSFFFFFLFNFNMQIFIIPLLVLFSSVASDGIACKDSEDCPSDTQFCRKTLWECCKPNGIGQCVEKKSALFDDESSWASASSCSDFDCPRYEEWPVSVTGTYSPVSVESTGGKRSPNVAIPINHVEAESDDQMACPISISYGTPKIRNGALKAPRIENGFVPRAPSSRRGVDSMGFKDSEDSEFTMGR